MKKKKCLFLIPTSYNDGREVPPAVMDRILEDLDRNFDGYTVDSVVQGMWRMENGDVAKDRSLKIWMVIDETEVPLLKQLIKKFAKVLEQEAIYFETMDWTGEFIRPE